MKRFEAWICAPIRWIDAAIIGRASPASAAPFTA
jgi:hypothetical protein